MKKKKLIFINLTTLLISASLLVNFTYAWIISNKYVDSLNFQTGEGKAEIKGFLFKQDKDGLVQAQPDITATQVDSGTGTLYFRFIDSAPTDKLNLGDLYLNEHALSTLAVPSYFVEIQVKTLIPTSYIRFNISSNAYNVGETAPDFTDFEFRYLVKSGNDQLNPVDFITPTSPFRENTQNQNGTPFVVSTQYTLSQGASSGSIYEIESPPEYRAVYEDYFAFSLVVHVRPRPLALMNYITNSTNKGESIATVGMKLLFDVEYSSIGFGS